MKIYVTSDIHLEFGDCLIKNEDNVDVLILGGDIMLAQDLHDHPETDYGMYSNVNLADLGRRQQTAQRFRDWPIGVQYLRDECAKYPNVYFMENDCRKIGDITFVGSTLWTDMNKGDPITLHAVADMMNDFRIIRNSDLEFTRLRPDHVAMAHRKSLGYIKTVVAGKHDEKFVVVGHHAPSKLSTHPRYTDDTIMNGAYSSSLDEFILDHPQIKLWTHGHTHEDFDYTIGTTRVVCNPRGYIGYEGRADEWVPKLVEVL